MAEVRETSIDSVDVYDYATFTSSERRWINKIIKLQSAHPDDVEIIAEPESNGGVLVAHIPKSWMKVSPPRKVNYTDEQRAALAERMAAARNMRGE